MEKVNFPRKFKVYLPLVLLFFLVLAIMPRNPKFSYDYKKGSPWMYETLISQFDFPILKTELQMQQERDRAGSAVIPYYRLDAGVASEVGKRISGMELGVHSYMRRNVADVVGQIYSKGVLSPRTELPEDQERYGTENLIFIQKDRRAVKVSSAEVYTLELANSLLRKTVEECCAGCNVDSLISATSMNTLIVPDLIYDQQITDLVHEEMVDNISGTQGVARAGQVIVSNGEIVTAEIEQLLDSYREEYDSSVGYDGNTAWQWLGNIIIAFSLVLILFLSIYYCNYRIFAQYNKYLYLLMIFALSVIASSIVARTDPDLFYLVPFTLIALYLLAFFKKRLVFIVYVISLLPMLLFAANGMELFIMYLTAGAVCMLVFSYFNRGWLQFVTALIVFAVMVLVWSAFRLIDGPDGLKTYHTVIDMALGSLLSVACYPLIFLFEKMFRLVSNSKLVELSDTSNKLLRLLADQAPGTFQHSLQVMNIADAAARSIDANVPLIRAGALYHDIGKIANPQCFTENENPGVNYHASLSPKESAQEIIRHVADGLALAEKYNLPDVIKDFIRTHHGTTCTGYFYAKYLNAGGDPDDVADFYYDGVKPTEKEQVILMLCDAVEAASRSLKDYSPENVSALVDRIIDGKADAGQLADADISLKELNIVREVIKSYLQQMYHSRVVYPRRRARK
ncbi:MAG: HDIG domain-containing protein [Bacteroidales bacterium]|nr:HDIG domain-containing protein [Bacteroidales bacterium]